MNWLKFWIIQTIHHNDKPDKLRYGWTDKPCSNGSFTVLSMTSLSKSKRVRPDHSVSLFYAKRSKYALHSTDGTVGVFDKAVCDFCRCFVTSTRAFLHGQIIFEAHFVLRSRCNRTRLARTLFHGFLVSMILLIDYQLRGKYSDVVCSVGSQTRKCV